MRERAFPSVERGPVDRFALARLMADRSSGVLLIMVSPGTGAFLRFQGMREEGVQRNGGGVNDSNEEKYFRGIFGTGDEQ